MNFRVTVEENAYPLKGGMSTLVGIYNFLAAAQFIAEVVKNKFKIVGELIIDEVDPKEFPLTSDKVFDYVQRQTRV